MRVWTIQPLSVWEQLQTSGSLLVDPARACPHGFVRPSCLWLVRQLHRRRGWTRDRLPWWCYCQRPDLRAHRWSAPHGREQVRLELEVSEERLFVMPYWAWDTVYCKSYLAFDDAEKRAWEARLLESVPLDPDALPERDPVWPLPGAWRRELHKSWERLFDPDLTQADAEGKTVTDAVLEELRLADVRRVTPFKRALTKDVQRLLERLATG